MSRLGRVLKSHWESLLIFIARCLYAVLTPVYSGPLTKDQTRADSIRIVAIADTHNAQDHLPVLPSGDILIHAGGLSENDTPEEIDVALRWLSLQPHRYKIFIAGNHDVALQDEHFRTLYEQGYPDLVYLQDSVAVVNVRGRTLRVYGNAQTPEYLVWKAFTFPRIAPAMIYQHNFEETEEGERWAHVPEYVDVMVTHGPPRHIVDGGWGCAGLLDTLWRVRPLLHVCGQIHHARGTRRVRWTDAQAACERVLDGVGDWRDWRAAIWGVAEKGWETVKVWSVVEERETIVANVASRDRTSSDRVVRNAEVFDI